MKKLTAILSSFLLLLIASGCNSDIFVDRTEPGLSEVTLDGDGGSASVRINARNLQWLGFSIENDRSVTYYDSRGDTIPFDCDASQVSRIVFSSVFQQLIVRKDGDRLLIESVENGSPDTSRLLLMLDYGFRMEYITIFVQPGEPVRLVSADYDSIEITARHRSQKRATTVNNVTDSPVFISVNPYDGCNVSTYVETWSLHFSLMSFSMPLPEHTAQGWVVGEPRTVMLGSTTYSSVDCGGLSVDIEYPPKRDSRSVVCVDYETVHALGTLTFSNPVSGRIHKTPFKCSVIAPVSYEISVEQI